jgi:hypothetical protein
MKNGTRLTKRACPEDLGILARLACRTWTLKRNGKEGIALMSVAEATGL